jgi:hypothetical protein
MFAEAEKKTTNDVDFAYNWRICADGNAKARRTAATEPEKIGYGKSRALPPALCFVVE